MEISSTLLEQALNGVNELALPVVGASCLFLLLRTTSPAPVPAIAVRPRRRRARLVRRGASVLGLLLSVRSPASAAGRRHPSAPAAPEVRTEPGRFPPPRLPGSAEPPVRDQAGAPRSPIRREPPWESNAGGGRPAHAAVHGGTLRGDSARLFGRAHAPEPWAEPGLSPGRTERAEPPREPRRQEPRAALSGGAPVERWHAVMPGETLWSIAAERLRTQDMRRIARYWPRIHRANRDEIGPNPDLIRPGQVLELPPEQA